MIFSSMYFIFVFFPVVCILYFALKLIFPTKIFVRNIFLCVASLFFYAWGESIYLLLMLASIIFNYFFALKLNSKLKFVIAVIFNLSFLVFFKYAGFFVSNVNSIFGLTINVPKISLPIGISFYTFQALSYVIDVYKKKVEPQKNILSLGLYISLFPQLIAGPIVRYTEIEKELVCRNESFDSFISGLKDFMFGLGAKVIIANNLAVFADAIYKDYNNVGSVFLWLAAFAYMFQIYFDFSGYSRMAIGLGKIFGFTFPENFNYPYCAASITDFWRRWHMTLSGWFKDYVYIPLGGNRCGVIKHIFNILITWLLTGLWHGASWNFVVWGLYYACLLIIEKYFVLKFTKNNSVLKIIWQVVTLFLILIGWVIFRLDNFSELFIVLKNMFSFSDSSVKVFVLEHADICSKLLFLIPAVVCSLPLKKYLQKNNALTFSVETIIAFVLFLVSVCMLIASTYNPFIYFRF